MEDTGEALRVAEEFLLQTVEEIYPMAWCLLLVIGRGKKNLITWLECSAVFQMQMSPMWVHLSMNFLKLKGGRSQID